MTVRIIADTADAPTDGQPFIRHSDAEYAITRQAMHREVFAKAADYPRLVEAVQTAASLLATLTAAHAGVVMDSAEDKATHDRVVAQMRHGVDVLNAHRAMCLTPDTEVQAPKFRNGERVSIWGDVAGTVIAGPLPDWNGAFQVAIDGDGLNYVIPDAMTSLPPGEDMAS